MGGNPHAYQYGFTLETEVFSKKYMTFPERPKVTYSSALDHRSGLMDEKAE